MPTAPLSVVVAAPAGTSAADVTRTVRAALEGPSPVAEVIVVGAPAVLDECAFGDSVTTLPSDDAALHALWQRALDVARRPWFATVEPGAVIDSAALPLLATELRQTDAVAVYTDERSLVAGDSSASEVLKPGLSPRLLLEGNYIGGLCAIQRDAAVAAGGYAEDDAPTGGYDLLLRLVDGGGAVGHIAVALLDTGASQWPPTSIASARDAARRCAERSLVRRGLVGTVETGAVWQRVRLAGPSPRASIIIPTRDRLDLLRECVDTIERVTQYPSFEIVVVDNGSIEQATLAYLETVPHRVIRHPGEFNFSDLVNVGVAAADGDLLVLLNNDTAVTDPDWLSTMVSELADPAVGAVGCKLLLDDGTPQHEGMALGLGRHLAINLDLGSYCRLDEATRDVVAVTAACVLIPRSAWDEIGGFDSALAVGYGDVDFCLRLRVAGHTVVYTPHASVTHLGQATRGEKPHRYDDLLFASRWPLHRSRDIDPFVNRRIEGFQPLWITAPEAMPRV